MAGILYLHGFCSSSKSRKGQVMADLFARIGVEVTLPDLDEGDFRNSTLTKQLALVESLVRALRPEMLIGSSLGGYQAALHSARKPDSVPALVLLAPAFDFANRLQKLLGEDLDRWQREGSLPLYHYRYQREVPLRYRFIEDAMRYEAIPEVNVPTTVLHGPRRRSSCSGAFQAVCAWPAERADRVARHGSRDARCNPGNLGNRAATLRSGERNSPLNPCDREGTSQLRSSALR